MPPCKIGPSASKKSTPSPGRMKAIGVMSAHSRRLSPQWLWLPLVGQRFANLMPDDLRAERFADGRTGGLDPLPGSGRTRSATQPMTVRSSGSIPAHPPCSEGSPQVFRLGSSADERVRALPEFEVAFARPASAMSDAGGRRPTQTKVSNGQDRRGADRRKAVT